MLSGEHFSHEVESDLQAKLANALEHNPSVLKLATAVKEQVHGQLARAEAYIHHPEAWIRLMSQPQTLEEEDTVAGAKDPLGGAAGCFKQPKEIETVAGAKDPMGGGLKGSFKQPKGRAAGVTSADGSAKSGGVPTITIEH